MEHELGVAVEQVDRRIDDGCAVEQVLSPLRDFRGGSERLDPRLARQFEGVGGEVRSVGEGHEVGVTHGHIRVFLNHGVEDCGRRCGIRYIGLEVRLVPVHHLIHGDLEERLRGLGVGREYLDVAAQVRLADWAEVYVETVVEDDGTRCRDDLGDEGLDGVGGGARERAAGDVARQRPERKGEPPRDVAGLFGFHSGGLEPVEDAELGQSYGLTHNVGGVGQVGAPRKPL